MKNKTQDCPICGANSLLEFNDHTYEFKCGRKKHLVQGLLHSVCSDCGTSMFLPEQLDLNNSKVRAYQKSLPDFISPAQILELREKYDITQAQANTIFGGGPTAFSKYERGVANPTAGIARYMLAALNDVKFMTTLAAINGVQIKHSSAAKQSRESIIDTLPKSLRGRVEQYAARVTLALQESCITLLEKGLDSVEMSEHSLRSPSLAGQIRFQKYVIDYQTQNIEVSELAEESEMITSSKFNAVIFKPQREHSKC